MAACHQIVNCEFHLGGRAEMLLVEVVDMILHCDELQPVFIRNDDPDGNACIFDNLLFSYVELLPRGGAAMAN